MSWKNLGRIFTPSKQKGWIFSHASLPVAHHIGKAHFRIFFSSRDRFNHSHIGYIEFNLKQFRVNRISETSILSPGSTGSFDQNGLSMGCITQINGVPYLYYVGWGEPVNGRFNNTLGLARWDRNLDCFVKYSNNPVLGLDTDDQLNLSYLSIIKINNKWTMYYGSHKSWGDKESDRIHGLKTAESVDGIHWSKISEVAIDFIHENEFAIARPSVVYHNGLFKMWFCYKGEYYRIGYAESADGVSWIRKDNDSSIEHKKTQWANKEVCYPNIFQFENRLYMLYNGNSYGKTGFGLAIWE